MTIRIDMIKEINDEYVIFVTDATFVISGL